SPPAPGGRMTQEFVYRTLGEMIDDTVTVVDEAITAARIVDRYLPFHTEQAYLGLAAGSLGLGLPASLGAQMAWPDRRVVATIGDGPLMYNVQALWAAARYRIPVTVLVVGNRAYPVVEDGMATDQGTALPPGRRVEPEERVRPVPGHVEPPVQARPGHQAGRPDPGDEGPARDAVPGVNGERREVNELAEHPLAVIDHHGVASKGEVLGEGDHSRVDGDDGIAFRPREIGALVPPLTVPVVHALQAIRRIDRCR